jgi:hypothetical protein
VPLGLAVLTGVSVIVTPARFSRVLRGALFVLSPVSLVVLAPLLRSAGQPGVPEQRAASVDSRGIARESSESCSPVVAVVFDELSFSYLYDGGEIGTDFPSLRRLAATATQYLDVSAPGHATLVAMPGFLAARRLHSAEVIDDRLIELDAVGASRAFDARGPDGLFATARRAGYATEIVGYYLPYCDLLGDLADTCQSFSFYNAGTFSDGASPVEAIETTLILWPRQFPLGILKNYPFARQQRRLVEQTLRAASRPLGAPAVFRLVHFSIPHLPFAFDRGGYNPPIDAVRTSPDTWYVGQMHYADRIFGELVEHLRRNGDFDRATVVVLSDHGFRFGGREADPLHVPFLVKAAGQRAPASVATPARAEILLREIVQRSCGQS